MFCLFFITCAFHLLYKRTHFLILQKDSKIIITRPLLLKEIQRWLEFDFNASNFRHCCSYCVYLKSLSFALAPTSGLKQTVSLTPCHLLDLAGCFCSQLQGLSSSCNHLWPSASVFNPSMPPTSFPSALRGSSSLHFVSTLLLSVLLLWDLPDLCRGDWKKKEQPRAEQGKPYPHGNRFWVAPHTVLPHAFLYKAPVHSGMAFWGRLPANGNAGIVVWLVWFTVRH